MSRGVEKFLGRSLLVAGVIGIRLIRQIGPIWGNVWLTVGWVIGYLLTEIDDLFYVYICNPRDEVCQRVKTHIAAADWRRAREVLVATRGERQNLPVHNILTGLVVAAVGVWVISSLGSLVAAGAVLGLTTRLFVGALGEKNFEKWYWMFAREFRVVEHKVILGVWGVLLALQIVGLIR
ncbi:hypothetical protein HYS82_01585 [Candidatus Amesbacteria bacterium]|nr:hypothetical protein [Candidatus Amesbacteria bacterium]